MLKPEPASCNYQLLRKNIWEDKRFVNSSIWQHRAVEHFRESCKGEAEKCV